MNKQRKGVFKQPLEEGDTIESDIIGFGEKGDAVLRHEGFIIFVKGTSLVKGKKIRAVITFVTKKCAFAEVTE